MARASSAEAAFGSTVTFPGGAVVPDWSAVTTPSARAALTALFAAFIGSKWRGMDGVEERVRRAVLQAYSVSIARAEPPRADGMAVPDTMGTAIGINFQPTGNGRAAIAGDLVLTADEVNPVLRALRENGIEVEALHNHMLDDEPRLFFMHFWANDDAVKLAKGMRTALDRMAVR